jgi:hypothetical protein
MGKVKSRATLPREADKERRRVKREKHIGRNLALLFGVAFAFGMILWLFICGYIKLPWLEPLLEIKNFK